MEQLDLFQQIYEPLPKITHLKLGTFFSGIGAPEKALERIGIDYELMFFSEIDKYAIQSYCVIHNEPIEKNKGDITKIKGKDLPYCDMWFGGFPCQDISLAGKQRGFRKGLASRSSLGWEMIRLLDEVEQKPKYVIFENVANIMSEPMRPTLNLFKQDLEARGYTLWNEILNAKDYGIPQNRERYFLVAILGNYYYKFPSKQELKLRLKDMLEDEVDEKYYLSDVVINKIQNNCAELVRKVTTRKNIVDVTKLKQTLKEHKSYSNYYLSSSLDIPLTTVEHWFREDNSFSIPSPEIWFELKSILNITTSEFDNSIMEFEEKESNYEQSNRAYGINGISPTLTTMSGGNQETKIFCNVNPSGNGMNGNVFDSNGLSPTLTTNKGEGIKIREATQKGYTEAGEGDSINLEQPNSQTRRGRVGKKLAQTLTTSCNQGVIIGSMQNNAYIGSLNDCSPSLTSAMGMGGGQTPMIANNLRIRKLTPLECIRLMGFDDSDYYRMSEICSNSQIYKQCGNSIVVNVLEAIFRELFKVGDIK